MSASSSRRLSLTQTDAGRRNHRFAESDEFPPPASSDRVKRKPTSPEGHTTMKKISAGLFIAADGVVGEPADWHFPWFNDEMGAAVMEQIGAADTLLFGRVTYDSFAGAWPERELAGEDDAEMAKSIGDIRKIVVSNQDLEFTWRNSEQLKGDLIEGVRALKEDGDGVIGMSGSISLVRRLLAAGLIDELHLLVHPVVIGKGLRLFEDTEAQIPLKLIKCDVFSTGVLNVVYGPADS
jgi:dihydrofolate reductase